jgi:hypothetical protein
MTIHPVTAAAVIPSQALSTGPTGGRASGQDERGIYRLGATAAALALTALTVGAVGMALTSRPGRAMADTLSVIAANPWPFVAAGVGLTLVSLADIFTIPALHLALGRQGRVLVLLASVTAILGDLLGVVGRLAQTAVVPLGIQAKAPVGTGSNSLLGAAQVLDVLDTTINTAGFLLVSVSFTCFGLLMMRGFSRPLGCIAMVAGLFTLLGQIPVLAPLFMVANVAYIAWYVGIARRFWRSGPT